MSSTSGVAVVTGGGRGIGRAIALRLAEDGYDLAISYLSDERSAQATADEVRSVGRRAMVGQMDSSEESEVARFFAAAEALGAVTAVVNNAGAATAVGRLEDNDLRDIRRDLDVNLFGVIACCKYGQAALARSGGGGIVNISSAAATLGSPGSYVHYAAAKAGVDALTLGLSKELAPDIRVNVVAPGTIWTEFHRDPDRPAKVAAQIPLGRAGVPDEISGAVSWLLSSDARFVTGANIRVAGGL